MNEHQLVEEHFTARGTGRSDQRLWRHLPGCDQCRARYRALSMLESLEPDASERARQRLARAIFAPRPPRRIFLGVAAAAAGTVVAAAVALVVARPHEPEFRARGGAPATTAPRPSFSISRVVSEELTEEGGLERVGSVIHARDRLAFSYVNPPEVGARHLMIFAVDGAGQFYWYWPAWTTPTDDPEARPIRAGIAPVWLAEAVRHPLPTGEIVMYAIFARRSYHVREIEAAFMGRKLDRLDAVVIREPVEVMR